MSALVPWLCVSTDLGLSNMLRSCCLRVLAIALLLPLYGCNDWRTYRNTEGRGGQQPIGSLLSSVCAVSHHLAIAWGWPSPNDPEFPGGREQGVFRASPIVVGDTAFIGSSSGYLYALDARTGFKLWQYPPRGEPALNGTCRWGSYGIGASATYAEINRNAAIIFGAPDPDPTIDSGRGSARLYALNIATHTLIWKSEIVAQISGCTFTRELHERIANSSPLVVGKMVYVGVADYGDDPIQNGKVVAVDLNTGHIVRTFSYFSTNTIGGAVWNSPASDGNGIYFTTGNTRTWSGGSTQPEPSVNNGLSMIRVDPATGAIAWKFQPVPYPLDWDPDWAAGAAVMNSSCGEVVESVQKDGWTYAVNANDGTCRWQFPPTAERNPENPLDNGCKFPVPAGCSVDTEGRAVNCPSNHNDTDYKQPGAVWGDVLVISTGGWDVDVFPGYGVGYGYTKLHALETCANRSNRVRWIRRVPDAVSAGQDGYPLGAPTVTGGIVYVTTNRGHLVAIADPSVFPPDGYQCSFDIYNPVSLPSDWQTRCVQNGYQIVPVPAVLDNVALPDAPVSA